MIRKFYNWMMKKAEHPLASWYLGLISFAESSISPIPPDPLMIPMILRRPDRAWFLAFLTTVTSALGGVVGYGIGLFLFEKVGIPVLEAYGLQSKFVAFQALFYKWGFWAIVIKALTPIPFKLVTITCGALHFNFTLFVIASTLSRGFRFYGVAALLKKFGEPMERMITQHIQVLSLVFIAVLVGGFFLVKYIF